MVFNLSVINLLFKFTIVFLTNYNQEKQRKKKFHDHQSPFPLWYLRIEVSPCSFKTM